MTDFAPREVLETECDRFNFETPGKIQGHGVMLLLQEPTLNLIQLSQNTSKIIGIDHKQLINQPITNFLEQGSIVTLQRALKSTNFSMINPLRLNFKGKEVDAILLRSDGFLFIELEEVRDVENNQDVYQMAAMGAMEKFQDAVFVEQLIDIATHEIRELTGFDRVMFYKFDEDYNGKVVAESTVRGIDSFLNLHFPASDIPKRVRELYLSAKSRYLPDLHEPQVPLFPEINPVTRKPSNLASTILRAVAPTHIEYMHNLGINSSMSFNVIKDGMFYGMFACHHYSGRHVAYVNRLVCEQIVEMFVAILEQLDNDDLHISELRPMQVNATKLMQTSPQNAKTDLLGMVNADGVAVFKDDKLHLFGYTPNEQEVQALIGLISNPSHNILYQKDAEGMLATNRLSSLLNGAERIKSAASGVIAVPISKVKNEYILWFRPEKIISATWAGNPDQAVHIDEKTMRVSPRKSFASWKKNVEGTSESWKNYEVQMAINLRDALTVNN